MRQKQKSKNTRTKYTGHDSTNNQPFQKSEMEHGGKSEEIPDKKNK